MTILGIDILSESVSSSYDKFVFAGVITVLTAGRAVRGSRNNRRRCDGNPAAARDLPLPMTSFGASRPFRVGFPTPVAVKPRSRLLCRVPGRLWRSPTAEVMVLREMLADLVVLVRVGHTDYNLQYRIRSESPDERHSELAYPRRLVRQLQLRGSLPMHFCTGALIMTSANRCCSGTSAKAITAI